MDLFQINSGNFIVELNLKKLLSKEQLSAFSKKHAMLSADDANFKSLCTLRSGILRYESETLLPLVGEGFKPKILLVFGNPATQSVKNGMFFFSKTDEHHMECL